MSHQIGVKAKSFFKKIRYNSPVVLTFSLISVLVMLIDSSVDGFVINYFSFGQAINSPLDWFRIFSYVLGHGNWNHLFSNIPFFLLLGPIVEEKYGSKKTLIMILVTAFVGSVFHITFTGIGGLGSSGIVFMFILICSVVNVRKGEIPLTLILIAVIFLGREVLNMSRGDNISQSGHILGGICGAVFGLYYNGKKMLRK